MKRQPLDERLEIYNSESRVTNAGSKWILTAGVVASAGGSIIIPPPAEAAVIYSGRQNKMVNASNTFQTVNFAGEGMPDFRFWFSASSNGINYQTVLAPAGAISIMGTGYQPSRLVKGDMVSGAGFVTMSVGVLAAHSADGFTAGKFLGSSDGGYLGVKFEIDSSIRYGWIQYKANSDASVGTIIDWAYEDSGAQIKAGDVGKKFNWTLFLPAIIPSPAD